MKATGFTIANSLTQVDPPPHWEPECGVGERELGTAVKGDVKLEKFIIKSSVREVDFGACSWAMESCLLAVGEDSFPASNIIALTWIKKQTKE